MFIKTNYIKIIISFLEIFSKKPILLVILRQSKAKTIIFFIAFKAKIKANKQILAL